MRYAIISDVHANEAALRAVLTDAADARAEKVICLGDVLGYGPDPVATLELAYRRVHVCLAGNHDDAVAKRFPTEDFTDFAADAVERHRALLSQEAIDWLRHLPYTCEFDGFACVHGDFSDPKNFNYILEPEDAIPSWEERPEQLLFVGHTHQPGIFVIGASGTPHLLGGADFTLEEGKRYIVNPGSVGYPRVGVCRSSYCIYDDQSRTVFFRTLPFDLDAYAEKMHGQGLNEAPWMLARAAERRRPAVRGEAKFGAGGDDEAAGRRFPQGRAALSRDLETPKRRFPQWVILGSLVVVLACAVFMVAKYMKRGVQADIENCKGVPELETVMPASVATSAHAAETVQFSAEKKLADGWTFAVENPEEQKIAEEFNEQKGERVFRIDHAGLHTVRFTKRLDVSSSSERVQPSDGRSPSERVYWNVEVLSGRRGVKSSFQFTTHLVFSDNRGTWLAEENGSGKRSAKNKSCKVPENAVNSVLTIDCKCDGAHELLVPYFGTRPHAPQR